MTSNFWKETSKKRKLDDDDDDEEESVSQTKKPVLQEPSRKVKVKKLSDADKRLANRLVEISFLLY